jgi:hypothetical protein
MRLVAGRQLLRLAFPRPPRDRAEEDEVIDQFWLFSC